MNKRGDSTITIIILVALLVIAVFIFYIPMPYTALVEYTDTEPYTAIETYQEQVPITVEECKRDISLNPLDYIERGVNNIDALLKGDVNKLLETCENVQKLKTITKSRDVVKYRTVQKERTETKSASLWMMWSGQVKDRYEE